MKKESEFQHSLINKLKDTFPDCLILKNDPNYKQGIPDLLILFKNKWAFLEVKKSKDAPHQPNQDWFINEWSNYSYCSFVYPENESKVIDDLRVAFNYNHLHSYLKKIDNKRK